MCINYLNAKWNLLSNKNAWTCGNILAQKYKNKYNKANFSLDAVQLWLVHQEPAS